MGQFVDKPSTRVRRVGMRAYKFNQGSGAPLNIMVQPSEFGFEGALLAKDSSTGSWSMSRMRLILSPDL